MKKVILTALFAFSTLSVLAITANINQATFAVVIENEFKEIAPSEVAKPVLEAVARDFKGATIQRAFINEKKEYKLELTLGEVTKTVYADANGNWINK